MNEFDGQLQQISERLMSGTYTDKDITNLKNLCKMGLLNEALVDNLLSECKVNEPKKPQKSIH